MAAEVALNGRLASTSSMCQFLLGSPDESRCHAIAQISSTLVPTHKPYFQTALALVTSRPRPPSLPAALSAAYSDSPDEKLYLVCSKSCC